MLERFLTALLGFYLGFSTFFSFVVAPILFSVLDRDAAGEVVSNIFPLYFAAATTILGISALLSFKGGYKKVAYLLLLGALIALFQELYILPLVGELKAKGGETFKVWHGISMLLNAVNIFIATFAVFAVIKPRGEEQN